MKRRALQPPFLGVALKLVDTKSWDSAGAKRWGKIHLAFAALLCVAYLGLGVTGLVFGQRERWVPISNFIFAAFWLGMGLHRYRQTVRKVETR